jgi:hypothetical protein
MSRARDSAITLSGRQHIQAQLFLPFLKEKLSLFGNPTSGGPLQALQLHWLVGYKNCTSESKGVPAS